MKWHWKTGTCCAVIAARNSPSRRGEQTFYMERGLLNDPQRCPMCRAAKRRQKRGEQRSLTTVVCASCGKQTMVPFVPRLDKPVYCNLCFEKMRDEPLTSSAS